MMATEVLQFLLENDIGNVISLAPLLIKNGFSTKAKILGMTNQDVQNVVPKESRRKMLKAVRKRQFDESAETSQQKKKNKSGATAQFNENAPKIEFLEDISGEESYVYVNRSPVMILFGAVVAERLGFDWDSGLSISSMMAGLNAKSKGISLGLMDASSETRKPSGEEFVCVGLLGREFECVRKGDKMIRGIYPDGNLIKPSSVYRNLQNAFGKQLTRVCNAMRMRVKSVSLEELRSSNNRKAYDLYCSFRPEINSGRAGWGQKSQLLFDKIFPSPDKIVELVKSKPGLQEAEILKVVGEDKKCKIDELQLEGVIYRDRSGGFSIL